MDFHGFGPISGPDLGRIWGVLAMFPYVKPSRNFQEPQGTLRNSPRKQQGTLGIPFALFQAADLVESVDRVLERTRGLGISWDSLGGYMLS